MSKTLLVTNVEEEKKRQPAQPPQLVKPEWEYHFSKQEWEILDPETRELFLLKLSLSEMIMDMEACLVLTVVRYYDRK